MLETCLVPITTNFVAGWPSGAIDPNQSYLLVVTYYESLYPLIWDSNERILKVVGDGFEGASVKLPQRFLRRVVCRLLIHPSGVEPPVEESKSFFEKNVWRGHRFGV